MPAFPLGDHIPKVIHQTYKSEQLPAELAENVRHIRALNPGWDYRFYDDAAMRRFIDEEYGVDVLARFDSINPRYGAARADLFRYLLIYRCGGAYLDIKSGLTKPLDEVIVDSDRFLLSHWPNNHGRARAGWGLHPELSHVPSGEYQQWHVIAAAGHPFLHAVIEAVLAAIAAYRPWRSSVRQQAVLKTTGPIVYTQAIFPLLHDYPHRLVHGEEEIGLRYSCTPGSSHKSFFGSHYSQLWEPLVVRRGLGRLLDKACARLIEARNDVAVKTWPLRQRLRARRAGAKRMQ